MRLPHAHFRVTFQIQPEPPGTRRRNDSLQSGGRLHQPTACTGLASRWIESRPGRPLNPDESARPSRSRLAAWIARRIGALQYVDEEADVGRLWKHMHRRSSRFMGAVSKGSARCARTPTDLLRGHRRIDGGAVVVVHLGIGLTRDANDTLIFDVTR